MIGTANLDNIDTKTPKEIVKQLQTWKQNLISAVKYNTGNLDYSDDEHLIDKARRLVNSIYIPLKNNEKWDDMGRFSGKVETDFNRALVNLHVLNQKQAINYCSKAITTDLANKDYSKIFYANKEIQRINQGSLEYYVFDSCPSGLPCNLIPKDVVNVLTATIKMIKQDTNLAKLQIA